jgi:non-specific serine/threonine protein kinase
MTVLGILATAQGNYDRAVPRLQEAVITARSLANRRLAVAMASSALANLGVATRGQGRIADGIAYHEEALAGQRAVGSVRGEMNSLADLCDVALDLADHAKAAARCQEALRLAWDYGEQRTIAGTLEGLACAAAAVGRAERAARLFGAADRLREVTGIGDWLPLNRSACERGIGAAREALGEAACATAWEAGRRLPLSQAVAEALDAAATPTGPQRISLTPREMEILPLLAEGRTDREIGAALFLSHRTVEHHVARLCAKLGVRTRPAAIEAARAAGLLPGGLVQPTDHEPATIG